jgi:pimeloyl-ACP methyl ester carboxylesterase
LASNVEIWNLVGPRLARSFRVLAYDQRGHGHSADTDDSSFRALASDCAAVAATLREAVVVGHSWGASVVLHCAASSPAAGVVCVDGGVFDFQGAGRSWEDTERMLMPPHIEGPAPEVLAMLKRYSQLDWDVAEPVVQRTFVTGEDGIMRRRTPIPEHMKIVRHMWEDDLSKTYAAITCPILLVPARAAAPSPFTDAKESAITAAQRLNPRVRVEWIESIHDVPLAAPDELAHLIAAFAADL